MNSGLVKPEDVDGSFIPTLRADVAEVQVADEAVLYEQDTGGLHRLDTIAVTVCSLFDGQTSVSAATDELVQAFDAPYASVEADVLAFVRDLARRGLLETAVESDGV